MHSNRSPSLLWGMLLQLLLARGRCDGAAVVSLALADRCFVARVLRRELRAFELVPEGQRRPNIEALLLLSLLLLAVEEAEAVLLARDEVLLAAAQNAQHALVRLSVHACMCASVECMHVRLRGKNYTRGACVNSKRVRLRTRRK